jgi:hypothetical protein
VYAVVVAVYACLLQHLGSGPIWSTKIDREVERCVDNWWANLLYINNYVNTSAMVSAAPSILLRPPPPAVDCTSLSIYLARSHRAAHSRLIIHRCKGCCETYVCVFVPACINTAERRCFSVGA